MNDHDLGAGRHHREKLSYGDFTFKSAPTCQRSRLSPCVTAPAHACRRPQVTGIRTSSLGAAAGWHGSDGASQMISAFTDDHSADVRHKGHSYDTRVRFP